MNERLAELREMQDDITAQRRDALIGSTVSVLVDAPGVGRTHREAPEIDGIVHVGQDLVVGDFAEVEIVDALGPDLVAAGFDLAVLDLGGLTATRSGGALMVESSQIATWANAVTVGRLLLSPLMFWVIPNHPRAARGSPSCSGCSSA